MNLKKFLKAAVLPIFATALIISCGETKEEIVANEIQQIMETNKAVGLAVVAVKDGQVVYNNTFGYKDLDAQTPLSKDDIFRIASISKSFTATGIMQLVEQGKLDLEADVSDILGFKVRNPKYPKVPVTVRMLLSHSSSMNDYNGYFSLNSINPDSSKTWKTAWNDYEPGTKYEYCNMGFNTLGTIIEIVSGERFDQYIVNHIMKPLGVYAGYEIASLDSSKFVKLYEYDTEKGTFVNSPDAYAPRTKEIANYVMGKSTPIFSPTGGVKISAQDLAKVMMMHMGLGTLDSTTIINKESAELMQSQIIPTNEEGTTGYGFAICTADKLLDGVTMIGHTGSAYGVYTAMFWDAERKFGFVVMTNGCTGRRDNGFMSIHRETVACLYNNFVKEQ